MTKFYEYPLKTLKYLLIKVSTPDDLDSGHLVIQVENMDLNTQTYKEIGDNTGHSK